MFIGARSGRRRLHFAPDGLHVFSDFAASPFNRACASPPFAAVWRPTASRVSQHRGTVQQAGDAGAFRPLAGPSIPPGENLARSKSRTFRVQLVHFRQMHRSPPLLLTKASASAKVSSPSPSSLRGRPARAARAVYATPVSARVPPQCRTLPVSNRRPLPDPSWSDRLP